VVKRSWLAWGGWLLGVLPGLVACGGDGPRGAAEAGIGRSEQAFINGDDDRQEYFELNDPAQLALMQQSAVTLMTEVVARQLSRGNVGVLPTWGESNALCPGEPFADQPAAAFCSGVLVDWDLVLTSGHCVDVVPLNSMRVAFGYYFQNPGQLALRRQDVYRVAEVIVARDDAHAKDRLDFAWLRLADAARPPRQPAILRSSPTEVEMGEPIIAINAGGGVPLKLDAGGRVRDVREAYEDYFVVDTDTSEGSSGGAAFNEALEVVGTLARGAPDFVPTNDGCVATDRETDPELAREQFTYANRSLQGLCEVEPEHWLCDTSCGGACEPPPPPPPLVLHEEEGCSLGSAPRNSRASALGLAFALAALARRRRAR
jgi:hypothetical protein